MGTTKDVAVRISYTELHDLLNMPHELEIVGVHAPGFGRCEITVRVPGTMRTMSPLARVRWFKDQCRPTIIEKKITRLADLGVSSADWDRLTRALGNALRSVTAMVPDERVKIRLQSVVRSWLVTVLDPDEFDDDEDDDD